VKPLVPALAAVMLALLGCAEGPVPESRVPEVVASVVCPLGGCVAEAAERRARGPSVPCDRDAACTAEVSAACDDAHAHACTVKGLAAWGQGAPRLALVFGLVDRACALGETEACLYAGRLLVDGRGTAKDEARGTTLLVKACDAAEARACLVLAARTAAREDPKAKGAHGPTTAEGYRLAADCASRDGEGCFSLGLGFLRGEAGFPADPLKSAAFFTRGCAAGHVGSCNELGTAYFYGAGVEKNAVTAASLYERACRGGDMSGCANVGFLAERGEGVPLDRARAEELYGLGCSGGRSYGCLHLAMMQERARAPRDGAALERACQGGEGKACAFLAILLEDTRDDAGAMQAGRRACSLGHTLGCRWVREHAH